MAQDQRFSHITVNAGEEDDVVIQAGAYARPEQERFEAEPAPEPAPAPRHAERPQPRQQAAPHPKHAAPKHEDAASSAYQEQTLDDLDAGPMSGMQKAVLVGVGIIIVAAIVYFALFMR